MVKELKAKLTDLRKILGWLEKSEDILSSDLEHFLNHGMIRNVREDIEDKIKNRERQKT